VSLGATDVKELFSLPGNLTAARGVKFVVLNLNDASGKVISHNVYWLAADNNFKALNEMAHTRVETTVLKTEIGKTETNWTLKFTNKSKQLAFFVRPQLQANGEEILPCYWSASYFSLAPGESITVSVSAASGQVKSKLTEVRLDGWNLLPEITRLGVR